MPDELAATLAEIVGAQHVLVDAASRASYETDWTRRFGAASRLVVRPANVAEVSRVLRACAGAGVCVVPQGGNTGLVGGGVPRGGEAVVSLRRLDAVGAVDPLAGRLVAGAGASLRAVQDAARASGLDFGIDMASRDSATVGGMVATDAGGTRVVRHGRMRAQVVGIEAVLADGSVISRLDGPVAGGGGYDVAGLLAGSEGTLAVITAVALRLVPARGAAAVALVGVPGTRAALDLAAAARPLTPDAVEVFYANGLALVCAHTGLRPPLQAAWPAYVLIEVCGDGAHSRLSDLLTSAGAEDAALAESPDDQRRMWAYRERHAEAIAAAGVPHKLDVALPQHRLAEFVDAVAPLVRSHDPAATCVIFGHLGVGNLHVNVLGLPPADDTVDDAVLRLVAELGGSIGAEHGIGVAKARWLPLTRSAADLAAMGAIKRALDPAGLLNPGVLLAADGRAR